MAEFIWIKDACIEIVINNVSRQGNVKIKLNLKVEQICGDFSKRFCGISKNARGFCLALSEAYSKPCETHNIKCFAKTVKGWIQSTIFEESSILDVLLGSEYVSDYPEAFSIIINIESSTLDLPWIFLIWLIVYLSI